MKQELPLAVALLAIGCLLWFARFQSTDFGFTPAKTEAIATSKPNLVGSTQADSLKSPAKPKSRHGKDINRGIVLQNSSSVVPVSYQEDVVDTSNIPPTPASNGAAKLDLNASPTNEVSFAGLHQGYRSTTQNLSQVNRTNQLLRQTAKALEESKPFGTTVELTGNMFERSFKGTAQYYQMGQGSGKVRVELQFANASQSHTSVHLCDGRFVYNIHSHGNAHELEFVDVQRVELTGQKRNVNQIGMISTGGMSGVLRQLANSFDLVPVDASTVSESNAEVVLRGSWSRSQLSKLLPRLLKSRDKGNDETKNTERQLIPWKDFPGQLPHAVEVILGRDDAIGLFPQAIRYYQFDESRDQPGRIQTRLQLSTRFGPIEIIEELKDKYFVIDSRNLESTDSTDHYIARLESIQLRINAQASGSENLRTANVEGSVENETER